MGNNQRVVLNLPKVDVNQLPDVQCECGYEYFREVRKFKRIPAVLSETGKDELLAFQIFICDRCNREFQVGKDV